MTGKKHDQATILMKKKEVREVHPKPVPRLEQGLRRIAAALSLDKLSFYK